MKKSIAFFPFILLLLFSYNSNAQEPYLGDIKLTAVNFTQQGWAECNGQLLAISSNTALFSLLGTTYGGDGQTTFALPDLRSRVPIHEGQGAGLPNYTQGQQGGTVTNTLVANNLPQHTHPAFGVTEEGSSSTPTGNYLADTKLLDGEYAASGTMTQMGAGVVGNNSTSNQAVNNMQPYLALKYVIAIQGLFPSEN